MIADNAQLPRDVLTLKAEMGKVILQACFDADGSEMPEYIMSSAPTTHHIDAAERWLKANNAAVQWLLSSTTSAYRVVQTDPKAAEAALIADTAPGADQVLDLVVGSLEPFQYLIDLLIIGMRDGTLHEALGLLHELGDWLCTNA